MAKALSKHAACPACGRGPVANKVCTECLAWIDHGNDCDCRRCVTTTAAQHDYASSLLVSAKGLIAASRLAQELSKV